MTKQELFTDPTFLRLPEVQQNFVRHLVENGNDKLAAAHLTWNCSNDASANAMACRILKKAGVAKVTNMYFGIDIRDLIPTREEVAAAAWQRFQGAKDGLEAIKWMALFNQTIGYNTRPSDVAPATTTTVVSAEDELMAELEQRTNDPTRSA